MADIIEVILADHKRIRRLRPLGALDDATRYGEDPCAGWMLAPVWCWLSDLLELHADAEEGDLLSGPVRAGQDAIAQMKDSIADHDDFREVVREARLHAAGSAIWWRVVAAALWASGGHVAREERGALAAFGRRAAPALRSELGRQWAAFIAARTRDAHRKRESATALPGEPGQARPGTAPSTTHPEIVLPFRRG